MNKLFKAILSLLLTVIMAAGLVGCSEFQGILEDTRGNNEINNPMSSIEEDGSYNDFDSVAEYIKTYNKLPSNFITKKEARNLGWEPGKNLWDYAEGKSIGGDFFGNYEDLLPDKDGRTWYECDINYKGGKRGADRIVFSNDGLIYMTRNHYESFTEYND